MAIPQREMAWLAYQALDQSDDIILVLEAGTAESGDDTIVIAINGAFRRASGYSDDQIVGNPVVNLFPSGKQSEILINAIRVNTSLRTEAA